MVEEQYQFFNLVHVLFERTLNKSHFNAVILRFRHICIYISKCSNFDRFDSILIKLSFAHSRTLNIIPPDLKIPIFGSFVFSA